MFRLFSLSNKQVKYCNLREKRNVTAIERVNRLWTSFHCSVQTKYHKQQGNISLRFSRNSQAFASEFQTNIEDIFLRYYIMHGSIYVIRQKTHIL